MSEICFTRTNAPDVLVHVGIIRKIAWKYAGKTGIPFEDLLAEGTAFALQTANEYRNDRGVKFSVFVGIQAKFGILNAITAESKFDECVKASVKNTKTTTDIHPQTHIEQREDLRSLSISAKVVVHYVFKYPQQFLDHSQEKARKKIRLFLIEKGWSEKAAVAACNEIRQMLKGGEDDVRENYSGYEENRF